MDVLGQALVQLEGRRHSQSGVLGALCLPFLTSDEAHGGATIAWDPMGSPTLPYVPAYSKTILGGKLLAIGDEEGVVSIFNTNSRLPNSISQLRPNAQWVAHQNAIFDLQWLMGDSMMATASGDKTVGIWDTRTARLVSSLKSHNGSVRTICGSQSCPAILASGGRDGCVMIWDTRCSELSQTIKGHVRFRPVHSLQDAHKPAKSSARKSSSKVPSHSSTSVTSVGFLLGDSVLASAGAANGTVKFWDMRQWTRPAAQLKPDTAAKAKRDIELGSFGRSNDGLSREHGIQSLAVSHSGSRLLVSSCNGVHHLYDALRPHLPPVHQYRGHTSESFYIGTAFSPDDSHFISGSTDGNAYIWEVAGEGDRPLMLEGHRGEVSGVAWCAADPTQLATCGDDSSVRIWKVDRETLTPRLQHRVAEPALIGSLLTPEQEEPGEDKENICIAPTSEFAKATPARLPLAPITRTPVSALVQLPQHATPEGRPSGKHLQQRSIMSFMTPKTQSKASDPAAESKAAMAKVSDSRPACSSKKRHSGLQGAGPTSTKAAAPGAGSEHLPDECNKWEMSRTAVSSAEAATADPLTSARKRPRECIDGQSLTSGGASGQQESCATPSCRVDANLRDPIKGMPATPASDQKGDGNQSEQGHTRAASRVDALGQCLPECSRRDQDRALSQKTLSHKSWQKATKRRVEDSRDQLQMRSPLTESNQQMLGRFSGSRSVLEHNRKESDQENRPPHVKTSA